MSRNALAGLLLLGSLASAGEDYLVLFDGDAFLPAAKRMAALHGGRVEPFGRIVTLLPRLRAKPPRFVVYVLPPERIDVDLSHTLLTIATQIDDDPFIDFEYGFVTGRDGAAALRFVERIDAAGKREYGRRGALFGTWEGAVLPKATKLSPARTLGYDFDVRLVHTKAGEAQRTAAARAALESFAGRDVLLFFSHGYPDRMAGCFSAPQLREWKIALPHAVLFNCACYNGAPGRWYAPGADGRFTDRGKVAASDSVALQLLDSGLAAYIGGIDPWHGPLNSQVFQYAVDDGMRLGAATKMMFDRLALAFAPERIHYPPTAGVIMTGEGRANRLRNGAGMILYGDPAFAPFAKDAKRLLRARIVKGDRFAVTIEAAPLLDAMPGAVGFMLPQARLMDYYSVKTRDVMRELKMEVYRVVDLPQPLTQAPRLKVRKASARGIPFKTGDVQTILEQTPHGQRLHIRVPIDTTIYPVQPLIGMARMGFRIELSE